nr:MAG TPA: hypothetical protein [Caudoviricetes sp.]
MADQRKRLSELPTSTSTDGLYTLGVDAKNEGVKIPLGDLFEGVKKPATDAQSAAQTAVKTANEAKSMAGNAQGNANIANQTATTALNTANAAAETASDAKTAADDAKSAAETAVQTADDTKKDLTRYITPRVFVNAQSLLGYGTNEAHTLDTIIGALSTHPDFNLYHVPGAVITFLGESGWEAWQYAFVLRNGMQPPQFDPFSKSAYWRKFGGSAAVGNTYNVTVDAPKAGFYDLASAIAKAYEKGFNNVGVQITFAIADKSWKTYQFIGANNDEATFTNENNWVDLAGMSAGAETLINIDALCGSCTTADYYTLEYAIAALQAYSAATGINYAKSGLVITYQAGEDKFETRQFQSTVGNFGEAALWTPFGGGGDSASVKTSDEPAEDGADAFSTGGAYKNIPTAINVDSETEGIVKLALENAAGEIIGEQKQFAVGTGSGGGSGIVMEITPKESPLYGQAGGTMIFRCAITLKNGAEFESGIIERVELYDRDTNALLETYRLNQAASDDKDATDDFAFDVSRYFTLASSRRFKFIAYDDADRSASRNVNVTAVDVTIRSEQTLHYTAQTVIPEGSTTSKQLPMFRFPNNASDKGINCTVEILIGGVWKTLGTTNVNDTFAHQITINPSNCCGSVLTHGAYPIRIHGVDVASGVVGNYLHTAVMVVNTDNKTPIVVSRWYTENESGTVKQHESIDVDFAAYAPTMNTVPVDVVQTIGTERTVKQSTPCARGVMYHYTQRVAGIATDGSESIQITVETKTTPVVKSETASWTVKGSLLNIESVSAQLMYDMDMSGRSNSDADKTIRDGGFEMVLHGSNYTTNGFVKDSYGTPEYGTDADTGLMAARIAENVTGVLNDSPFNVAAIETNGMAIQFRIRVRHIADESARLISCIKNGIGFYVTGKNVVWTTDNGAKVAHTITAALKEDALTDVAIVIEPVAVSPYGGIGVVKMYFDGELIGTSYYETGSLSRHDAQITFDGTHGDLYLYNIRKWETYYTFEQSFNNYLLKLANTESMITEYNFNQVMASQTAEGRPARNIPQLAGILEKGIACLVMCKSPTTENVATNYPEYIEGLDGDKKTPVTLDWYIYYPGAEWRNIVIEGVPTTNQGTTSSMRPVKNKKAKTKKCIRIRMMYDRDYILANYPEHIAEYDFLTGLSAKKKIQIVPGSIPTNIYCIKVDYSESGGANNGASTNLYNDLTRALGADYMTPAQIYYTGEYELNPCISSIPCALFRTDANSPDATLPSNAYFHAKGNFNHDKGDAAVFGFEDVPGYNDGCLNYGDFYELIAAKGQTLDAFIAAADKSTWEFAVDPDKPEDGNWNVIVVSEYCGNGHRVFRRADSSSPWSETTGTMRCTGGRWRITGDVVNPVENYELRAYNAMDWFQGVSTPEDMVAPGKDGKPAWLTYFESRYPDDDNLNQAYEDGRKVPYSLFNWLRWCEDCNQHKTAADGNITIDGTSVSGTPENRLKKFARELHKMANPHSMICYHVFTDYIAAVDQRSKNMMVGFYLEPDGSTRMYLNHLYDGDTILGSDNDCGLTIPAELDPNNDPNGFYQGHDSVLFTQLAASDKIWIADYTGDSDVNDTTKTTTVADIAKTMRSVELRASGLRPFSPNGLEKYWIIDRLSKWPKLVSSYDGIRKYIEASKPSANYFYALHGLSIQRLSDFIETRFRYRDGFYQCGDTFASAAQMRCTGTNMTVKITAVKPGYFGIGVDTANAARESVYLNAGESAVLHTGNTNTGSGVMLYIFGADRIGELDLRNATPKQSGWDISKMTLLQRLIIGGAGHKPATNIGDELATLNLGQMPFLEEIDTRNHPMASINAEYCPRLKTVRASGSHLQSFTPAQTAPLETLDLPNTMASLMFVNLPRLKYGTASDGLTIAGFRNVKRLQIVGCPKIDSVKMLSDVVNGGAALSEIGITGIEVNAPDTMLKSLMASGVKGIGSDLEHGCDGITGSWILTKLIPDADLATLQSYFKHNDVGLTIHNAQYTGVVFDDSINDPANITNLDNGTFGDSYVPSGHITRIRSMLVPVKGKLNPETGVWEGVRVSESNYRKLYDGSDFDYADTLDDGFDVMMRCPSFYYKGVNDFKNHKKYLYWSSVPNVPISSARNITRKKLADILTRTNAAIQTIDVVVGTDTLSTDGVIADTPNCNVYEIDVNGMKQVRYPAINSSAIGAVFVNAAGVIVGKFNLAVANTDFVDGEYAFTDVPEGATKFVFSTKNTNDHLEAIAVDSSDIEAIEPDWVRNDAWLGGVYQMSVDGLMRIRSISGVNVRCGNNTHATSTEWVYDADGRVKNTPVNGLNYSNKDRQNLAMRRGIGYQLFDYEMSKLMALLWYSMTGTRDAQLKCGYGKSAGGATGYMDSIGNADSQRTGSNNGNKCLGFESFFGCTWEVMDNVAVNVVSWESYLRNHGVSAADDPVDAKWHIYDPITKTERVVQGITSSGYCIGRTKHGRFADVIASKCTTDNSKWALNYCDGNYYTASKCRVVGRSSSYAYANGGLAYAYANDDSASAYSYYAARLAFRGTISVPGLTDN